MQRWWLGAVVAVLWPLSSWDLLAWTEEGQFCWQIVEHTAAAAQAEYASCCLGWFLERLIRFFLSFRLWETSQTSEEPIIYCVEFETRKDKNVKLNPQS